MTNKAKISDKHSSTRYTVEQTQALKELKEKGIDEHLIHSILPSLKETELEAAMRIWQKKFGLSPSNREERGKQMRFMMNRGFSIEVIQQVFSQAGEDNQ